MSNSAQAAAVTSTARQHHQYQISGGRTAAFEKYIQPAHTHTHAHFQTYHTSACIKKVRWVVIQREEKNGFDWYLFSFSPFHARTNDTYNKCSICILLKTRTRSHTRTRICSLYYTYLQRKQKNIYITFNRMCGEHFSVCVLIINLF